MPSIKTRLLAITVTGPPIVSIALVCHITSGCFARQTLALHPWGHIIGTFRAGGSNPFLTVLLLGPAGVHATLGPGITIGPHPSRRRGTAHRLRRLDRYHVVARVIPNFGIAQRRVIMGRRLLGSRMGSKRESRIGSSNGIIACFIPIVDTRVLDLRRTTGARASAAALSAARSTAGLAAVPFVAVE
eukprot:CAMPEP_0201940748 /NCGR_PEP_ID=MMETSP0903-20130614/45775_1 /ASSEMBLY_ACC=CAM_ASM_000552 /TAXON_ID=420261 /ORGANISM="Thalassiosira antarctica, Strain CCMP982" /LENGTH=186 /DNA_ID=CAMNT_0048482625 /DNA_START=186 /DNA_END=743 /DNA_ORIENTATION=-